MLEDLKYEDYAPHCNTRFELPDADGIELELVEVAKRGGSPQQEMFSLTFRGSADWFLQQQIYRLRHEILGEGELFLVPVGKDESGYQYEAGFNRLITPE